jgi:hypothetical protein
MDMHTLPFTPMTVLSLAMIGRLAKIPAAKRALEEKDRVFSEICG